MKLGMYSIYDKVAKEYSNPVYCVNEGVALRAFKRDIPENISGDYVLYKIGNFDSENAEIEVISKIEVVYEDIKE